MRKNELPRMAENERYFNISAVRAVSPQLKALVWKKALKEFEVAKQLVGSTQNPRYKTAALVALLELPNSVKDLKLLMTDASIII